MREKDDSRVSALADDSELKTLAIERPRHLLLIKSSELRDAKSRTKERFKHGTVSKPGFSLQVRSAKKALELFHVKEFDEPLLVLLRELNLLRRNGGNIFIVKIPKKGPERDKVAYLGGGMQAWASSPDHIRTAGEPHAILGDMLLGQSVRQKPR